MYRPLTTRGRLPPRSPTAVGPRAAGAVPRATHGQGRPTARPPESATSTSCLHRSPAGARRASQREVGLAATWRKEGAWQRRTSQPSRRGAVNAARVHRRESPAARAVFGQGSRVSPAGARERAPGLARSAHHIVEGTLRGSYGNCMPQLQGVAAGMSTRCAVGVSAWCRYEHNEARAG